MCQVEEEGLFQPEVDVASADMFARLAPMMGGEKGEILADLKNRRADWDKVLTRKELNMLNTTIAFTMASGSKAPNVIPQEASVTCNVRMAPSHSVEMVMKRLGEIAAQHNVELELLRHNEPSPITDPKSRAFHQIEAAMAKVYPDLPVLPFLLAGGFFAINGLRMALGKTDTKGKVRSEVQEDTLFSLMKQGKDRPSEEDPTRVSQRHACALDTDGRLAQLDTLKSAGIIDEKEYREKRQEILSGK
jgi:hypothetical protein